MDYKKIYNQLIDRAKQEARIKGKQMYYEIHHIKPRSLGGTGKNHEWKHHPNLVLLTAKEHFIAHLLLCEIYPDNEKLKKALWALVNATKENRYKVSARVYQRTKQAYIETIKGVPKSKEALEKRTATRKAASTYNRSSEAIQKGIETRKANGSYHYKRTLEHNKKLSEAKQGKRLEGKRILDPTTGNHYASQTQAIEALGISMTGLYSRLKRGEVLRM
jgi:hypothetical protein